MRIILAGKETPKFSFIQDVLFSVNLYEVEIVATEVELSETEILPGIIIFNLDDTSSLPLIKRWKEKVPRAFLLGFTETPETLPSEIRKLVPIILDTPSLDLDFMRLIGNLRDLYTLKQKFFESLEKIIGQSAAIQELRRTIEKMLGSKGVVLIQGESGAGKELVAQALASIHSKLVVVNCSAITENLFESELFGHAKGSFTGAAGERTGLFEEAANGVLFLDEIGDMPLSMQTKLLRTLQDGEFRPVGSNKTKRVSVRIICATNRDLRKEVKAGRFREDLFYRIHVLPIIVPPLRDRREDIPDLVKHFLSVYSPNEMPQITPEAWKILRGHSFPGNIRELENTIHRAVSLMENNTITDKEILLTPFSPDAAENPDYFSLSYADFREYQKEQEREYICRKIKEHEGSVTETAKSFDMQRSALYGRAARIGLNLNDFRKEKYK
ncbi:MAG: sigma-54 dependent transcriptional regulator [Fibrobacter sp.]|jgi:transcriptional regulator with GAF, ATPase, and Fis domain|nr:sigma-54 dependent transcriptional regulator [Fibrobacter sp.]